MARSAQELLVVIDATTEQLRRELRRADNIVATSTRKIDRNLSSIDASFQKINKAASVASTAMTLFFAAAAGGSSIGAIVRVNDAYTRMSSRLRLVTDSAEELTRVQDQLFELAQQTRSEFEGVVDLYVNLAANTKNLGVSHKELMAIVRVTNQAIQISGATAEEASAGVRQLIQGLASGELRGEELRSVMEQTRRLARAIADGLGVSIGGLRDMAEAGELTTDKVLQALRSQMDEIDKEFRSLERTVSQAMTQLRNSVEKAVANADMSELVEAIDELRATVTDPEVQQGVGHLATMAVNFVADMAKGLALLGNALADLQKADELFTGIGKRLLDNSGPGFLVRMLTGEDITDRVGDVLSGRGRSDLRNRMDPVKVTAPSIKSAPINLPNLPIMPPEFFTVDADDLVQSMERELAKVDELLMADLEKKGTAIDLSNLIEFDLPKQGRESIEELKDQLDDVGESTLQLQLMALQVGNSFADAFTDAIFEAKNLGDAMQSLVEDITRAITQALILKAIQTGINSYFGGGETKSANGNVFDQSGLVPFAKGGIVNSPTVFPFANGTGLMGEAGPEAILPLKRLSGGNLGVQASGGGVVVNINNYSQAQVAANSRRGPDSQQVIDIMVEDSFNRLLGSGRLDASLAANTGIRRPGRF